MDIFAKLRRRCQAVSSKSRFVPFVLWNTILEIYFVMPQITELFYDQNALCETLMVVSEAIAGDKRIEMSF